MLWTGSTRDEPGSGCARRQGGSCDGRGGKSAVGRCGESRGSHRPFVGARGAPERGGRGGSNDGVNGFNAIEDRGEIKKGIKGGMMAG
jgi:hypothetical protein